MNKANTPLQCKVEGKELVIRVGLETLKFATEHCPRFYDPDKDGDGPYVKVVDLKELAADVRGALLHEEEDGSTPLHVLLDDAVEAAFDNGSLAFAEEAEA